MKPTIFTTIILTLTPAIVSADEWCHNADGLAEPDCLYCCQDECNPTGLKYCVPCCVGKGTYCNSKEVAFGYCDNPA